MLHWQKLAAACIAVIGATTLATPAPAMSGLQSNELIATTDALPDVTPASHKHHRRWDNDISIHFGFPFFAYGGYPYHRRSYYYYDDYDDDYYDDSYLHCHGRKYWKYGKLRCTGRWHRHY